MLNLEAQEGLAVARYLIAEDNGRTYLHVLAEPTVIPVAAQLLMGEEDYEHRPRL